MAWPTRNPGTRHAPTCTKAFARLDATCARCKELANGAPARAGWSDGKRAIEAQQLRAIRAHDCKARECGPVCTFGDW